VKPVIITSIINLNFSGIIQFAQRRNRKAAWVKSTVSASEIGVLQELVSFKNSVEG